MHPIPIDRLGAARALSEAQQALDTARSRKIDRHLPGTSSLLAGRLGAAQARYLDLGGDPFDEMAVAADSADAEARRSRAFLASTEMAAC